MIKYLTVSLATVATIYAEYIYVSPKPDILPDSYLRAFYDSEKYYGFSLGLFDKIEIFTEDKKTNSLYGGKILLLREDNFYPSVTYTTLREQNSKEYYTLGKTFSFIKGYAGYEQKYKNFYGGVDFLYSKDLILSYQYDDNHHNNLWMRYTLFDNLNITVGKYDDKYISTLSYRVDFSKNYLKDDAEIKNNRIDTTMYSDELEMVLNSSQDTYQDVNVTVFSHAFAKKNIFIKQKEFVAFKNKKVSKDYMKDAIELKREFSHERHINYDAYIEPEYTQYVSKNKPLKDDFSGFVGFNIGGDLPLFVSVKAKVSSDDVKEKKTTINFVKDISFGYLRAELGRFDKKDGYDIEFLKTYQDERFAFGFSTQKYKDTNANFLSLNYIPKISKTISLNLKLGTFFNSKNGLDLSIKKFYKDATLGTNLFVQEHTSEYRLKVYLQIPLNFGKVAVIPKMDIESSDFTENYIDSKNSFENTVFDKNNITIQNELIDFDDQKSF